MNQENPLPAARVGVSVIIPTYRRPDVLPRAIGSVQRQTVEPAQILVVDDGSGDHTPTVVGNLPGVIFLQQENAGPARARNLGLQSSTGNYVASLDHDDEWDESFLETAVHAMESHQADVAWVNFRQTGSYAFRDYLKAGRRPGRRLPSNAGNVALVDQETALEFFLFSNGAASNSALVFRREALGQGWDPASRVADDLLVMARLLLEKQLRYVFLLRPLWTKHEDDASFSRNSEATLSRCVEDFQAVAKLGEIRFSPRNRRRWQKSLGNLRYKLAYHRLWSSGPREAWRDARTAFMETGLTFCAIRLLVISCLRKCARIAGIPPMSTWRRRTSGHPG